MIGIYKRTFTFLDKENTGTLYKALVRPHLEYGDVLRSPYLKRQSIASERVQRRATRLTSNLKDLSFMETLEELDLPFKEHKIQR